MVKRESLREAYGRELVSIAKEDDRIVVLDADLGGSTKSCYMEKQIPERFFEMGIAEQNMVSTAAGLSLTGKIPFVNSFCVFAAGQPFNQIRQGIALPKLNVKIVGSSSGLSDFGDGATHQSIEDVAIMRSIPNMVVINPVDSFETKKATRAIANYKGPVYFRISRADLPIVTKENDLFEIGKTYLLADGKDIAIFAYGFMVYQALKAREILTKKGIYAKVINVPTIKPLNIKEIKDNVKTVRGVITAEEHSIIGGLGGAICEALSDELIKIKRVGINDEFGQSAESYEELIKHYKLTPEEIAEKAKELMK